MTKLQFLFALRDRLAGLPQNDIEERLRFYSEMIEDRMEEGLSEEEAVAAVGSVDEIASQITAEIPSTTKKTAKRHLKTWEIILLILGAPLWVSLLIAVFSIVLSVYISAWAVIVSLWSAFVSVAACALGGVVGGVVLVIGKHSLPGIALIGAGALCAGISIFLFVGCKMATKGLISLTKHIFKWREAK